MNRAVHPVEQESSRRPRARPDTSGFPPLTRAVVERVVHSAADLEHATDLVMYVERVAAGITRHDTVRRLRKAKSVDGLPRSAHAVRLAHEQAGPGALEELLTAAAALNAPLYHPTYPEEKP
ncbi:hypothetical protein ACFV3N_17765 [Streptomyces bauhiniae]|uniref:hypothetical protein n=1 Tax=Streptomyces bauhiniae TaxID=2340725 RepID=UPI003658EF89